MEEHGRYGLQVHAALYRDLLGLLQREALIAMTVHALEVATTEPPPARGRAKPKPMPAKGRDRVSAEILECADAAAEVEPR